MRNLQTVFALVGTACLTVTSADQSKNKAPLSPSPIIVVIDGVVFSFPEASFSPELVGQIISELKERKKLELEYFHGAELIAGITGDVQANDVLEFTHRHSVTYIPISENQSFGPGRDDGNEKLFSIHIALPRDYVKFPLFKEQKENGRAFAEFHYREKTPRLVIYHDLFSPVWAGILLLHEGDHAVALSQRCSPPLTAHELALEEIRVFGFMNRLLSSIGGKRYAVLLEKEVKRIEEIGKNMSRPPGGIFLSGATPYHDDFDLIFGQSRSEAEKRLRTSFLHVHAMLTVIERQHALLTTEDVTQIKAQWYRAWRGPARGN